MSMLVDLFSWAFILLGSFLLLTGSLGLIRLPDFWSRLHGASISDTGGVLFLILGMMLHVTTIWVFFKLLAIANLMKLFLRGFEFDLKLIKLISVG